VHCAPTEFAEATVEQPAQENRPHIVVGRAPDLEHARMVFHELQSHGIDAGDVRLAGAAVQPAEAFACDLDAREELDARTLRHLGHQAEAGAFVGALAGAAIGAGGGLLAASGDIGGSLALFVVVVLVFTAIGAWVGATVSATRSMGYDDTRYLPFDATGGATWVAVRVRDDRDAAHTAQLLEREGITLVEEHPAAVRGDQTVG
jgi:hypothetical protein